MIDTSRQFPRYALEAEIELATAAGPVRGRTKNVSRGGLAAYVERSVPVGLRVMVRMSLVFDEDSFSEPLELPARVVWCTPVGERFQLGTSFLPTSNEQATYLDMFLRYLREGIAFQESLLEEDSGNLDDPFK